ncbi:HK97 gp10 family phage protein [Kribbella solani]|uniref:HK97 gp10 family phage protein n=1 Tax=Kribbella solani TaxID=236067 RepID=UPI0029A4E214|nr:HK97 gp10 family phage protein [Kribbella solani]MDX3006740.1 HK97 gp10 family phage protein [Kribbella solani]
MTGAIKVDGLSQFVANLKSMDRELPKALRVAFNGAAEIVVKDARHRVPSKTGKARASVKAKSTQTAVRISGGGNRAPYYPWLDFGGRVGRNRSVRRTFQKDGRYIYDAYYRNINRFGEVLEQALLDVAAQAGVEVD